jgi:hypothetical protein
VKLARAVRIGPSEWHRSYQVVRHISVLPTFQRMLKIRQPLPCQSPIVQVVIIGILLASPLYRTDHR